MQQDVVARSRIRETLAPMMVNVGAGTEAAYDPG
jgi:hypothetical protein